MIYHLQEAARKAEEAARKAEEARIRKQQEEAAMVRCAAHQT
jgi:hypothetical protein